jgi:phosphatidylserine synthase
MENKKFFYGLPASASTIIILVVSFFKIEFFFVLLLMLIVSFFMISNIRFPKPGIKVNSVAAVLILISVAIGKTYYGFAPLLLLAAILVYSIGGPVYLKFFAK